MLLLVVFLSPAPGSGDAYFTLPNLTYIIDIVFVDREINMELWSHVCKLFENL